MDFSELAAAKFRKLDQPIRERIAARLADVARDPARYLTRHHTVEAYRLRIGDYRVILDVDWDRAILRVLTVGHRGTVYR